MKRKTVIWKLPITMAQAACVLSGFALYGILTMTAAAKGSPEPGVLKRAPPGGGETSYEMLVEGLDKADEEKKIQVEIPVRERKYEKKEVFKLYDRLLPELTEGMLGENKSLDEVRTDLNLRNTLAEYGLKLRWESSDPELIDSFGQVHNQELREGSRKVRLNAWATDGEYEREYEFEINICPPMLEKEEQLAADFRQWADGMDQGQQTESALILPEIYEGRRLTYSLSDKNDYRVIPVLGFLMAALLHVKEKTDKQNLAKKREQQLLLDYSEVVSKLLVFIGAGLTVRGAWERIAGGYEEAVKQGKSRKKPAYEEMIKTVVQMQSGMAEGRAFNEFGRRCALQPYLKLSALLEQNRKNGGRQLRSLLELEMSAAFEQRKNLAKKLGDEAGTKLLFPLLMMLAVVMVIIVVPAFLSFY